MVGGKGNWSTYIPPTRSLGGGFNQPIFEKYAQVKMGLFPPIFGEKHIKCVKPPPKKHISLHSENKGF